MPASAKRPALIELNLHTVGQLFNTMDPSPFDEKDLDDDAEAFISGWAWEYPRNVPLILRVHLDERARPGAEEVIRAAIHNHFDNRAKMADLMFRRLMRRGRTSLLIGMVFLVVCLLGANAVNQDVAGFSLFAREGLTIAGWVAMWRPMEIYLYDWWPLMDQRRHFRRLSEMPIEVVTSER